MSSYFNAALTEAITRRLRPRLPWWYRFRIEIEPQEAHVRHRILRLSLRSGGSSLRGFDDASDELELFLENLLLGIQADIWNVVHRRWPVPAGRVGSACTFGDLPSPEVRVRDETIDLWFEDRNGGTVLRLEPIHLEQLAA
jgi:hypothetical protein